MEDILEDNKQVLTVNGKQLRVTIPAGVEDGQTLRLRGQGGAGRRAVGRPETSTSRSRLRRPPSIAGRVLICTAR